MNQVKLRGTLEGLRDMQTLPDLGVDTGIFRIGARAASNELCLCNRISSGKECDIYIARDQPLRENRDDTLPWPIMPGRDTPRDWSEHCESHQRPYEPV